VTLLYATHSQPELKQAPRTVIAVRFGIHDVLKKSAGPGARGIGAGPPPCLYSAGTMAGSRSITPTNWRVRDPISNLDINRASRTAPTLKMMSPGIRIHTRVSMTGLWMISGERAYQKPVVML
jgi:hypothetical protein